MPPPGPPTGGQADNNSGSAGTARRWPQAVRRERLDTDGGLVVGLAAVCGYLPAALGTPVILTYVIGIAVLIAILLLLGRNPEKVASSQ